MFTAPSVKIIPTTTLPDSMAGLLENSINDAFALDREIYVPNYNEWHNTYLSIYCEVCLAGALIAGLLEIPPAKTVSPLSFDERTAAKLNALDNMRYGHWHTAFNLVYNRIASRRVFDCLSALPVPKHPEFCGWQEFEAHLQSMEKMLPDLRIIDRFALQR